ncbi:hypothetical protein [Microbacterium sp. T2.11-28]|uniref:hypothetical protein n=1 Tax=Microbacterium sp. T2.11-28 TaxID=3041169 RepID=UPI00247763C9|nr:hypothetical protein [Microbacterium sp. T2.11-28]CAI9386093.1 hypothetical protein MICABA_00173 [Microbacterium sp. T2.11-28]
MAKPKYFWEYPISGDTAAHARRGVGPATDFACPTGTTIHAPFTGRVRPFRNEDGGLGVRLVGSRFTLVVQHLSNNSLYRLNTRRLWRTRIAISGRSGTNPATGRGYDPHAHAYIEDHKTGRRMSFLEWQRMRGHRLGANARRFLGLK